jgi:molybdate transport system substrate-binding protein
MIRRWSATLALCFSAVPALAGEATIAVAANFLSTAEKLAALYEYQSGDVIVLAHGSTGRLYAQIRNGAPYDLFLAADDVRPEALEQAGVAAERAPYALGRLALVSREAVGADLAGALRGRRIAIADPAVAPYGEAALEAIEAIGLAASEVDLVYGDSVGQVAALFATGNVDLALLAQSQVPFLGADISARDLEGLYAPIRQDAVLLTRAADNPAAAGFFAYLLGDESAATIRADGYGVPE